MTRQAKRRQFNARKKRERKVRRIHKRYADNPQFLGVALNFAVNGKRVMGMSAVFSDVGGRLRFTDAATDV